MQDEDLLVLGYQPDESGKIKDLILGYYPDARHLRAPCQGGTGNRAVNHHDLICPERQHHRRGGGEHRLSQTACEGHF